MNLKKAIALVEFLFVRRPQLIDAEYDAAIQLLIETGKLTIDFREGKARRFTDLLPGETKD